MVFIKLKITKYFSRNQVENSLAHTFTHNVSAPLLNLFEDKEVQARMLDAVETARIYYTSDDVTVNLIWSILVLGVILLCKYLHYSNQCPVLWRSLYKLNSNVSAVTKSATN